MNDGCHMIISGMFYTSMLTKMSHLDLGLLALMWSTSMIGDYVVALHLVNSSLHENFPLSCLLFGEKGLK